MIFPSFPHTQQALWSRHMSDYFHLFIAAAILLAEKKKIIVHDMGFDETLRVSFPRHLDVDHDALNVRALSLTPPRALEIST